MPRISEQTRERRRQHILTSAWICFSQNGFHATSMDDVIAASGMASTTVYRYFESKEAIIHASTDAALARVRDIFVQILKRHPCPSPAETLALLAAELESRASHLEFDLTCLALQTWAEALRDRALLDRARAQYLENLDLVAAELSRPTLCWPQRPGDLHRVRVAGGDRDPRRHSGRRPVDRQSPAPGGTPAVARI